MSHLQVRLLFFSKIPTLFSLVHVKVNHSESVCQDEVLKLFAALKVNFNDYKVCSVYIRQLSVLKILLVVKCVCIWRPSVFFQFYGDLSGVIYY